MLPQSPSTKERFLKRALNRVGGKKISVPSAAYRVGVSWLKFEGGHSGVHSPQIRNMQCNSATDSQDEWAKQNKYYEDKMQITLLIHEDKSISNMPKTSSR